MKIFVDLIKNITTPDAVSPLIVEICVGEDSLDNPGPVGWGVAHHGPHNQRHLALDVLQVLRLPRHHGQVARPLVVQTKVLAEALRAKQLKALGHKIPDCPGVSVQTARGEALVGAVKEGEELVVATNLRDLLPLLLSGVQARWVVCACVKDDDRLGWGLPEIITQSIPIHPLLVGVPVPAMRCVLRSCAARPCCTCRSGSESSPCT